MVFGSGFPHKLHFYLFNEFSSSPANIKKSTSIYPSNVMSRDFRYKASLIFGMQHVLVVNNHMLWDGLSWGRFGLSEEHLA
jgi:hypothetical protein